LTVYNHICSLKQSNINHVLEPNMKVSIAKVQPHLTDGKLMHDIHNEAHKWHMIGITKNYQDVKIYSFVIASFNHTKNFHFLYTVSTAQSTPTHFSHFQEKINKLVTSLTL